MIDVSKLPAVRAQLERDIAVQAVENEEPTPTPAGVEYVRAPRADAGTPEQIR